MSDGTPKKTITFMVRMPIPDDADPAGQAAELLRYGVSGVEIVPHPRIPTPPVIDSVAKAIAEADLTDIEWDNDEWPERKDVYRRLAEAAIAAYEFVISGPTGQKQTVNYYGPVTATSPALSPGCGLIAARTVRQP
jgi:hypothetical protein